MSKSSEMARKIQEQDNVQEVITSAEMEADYNEIEQKKKLEYAQEVINQIFGVYK